MIKKIKNHRKVILFIVFIIISSTIGGRLYYRGWIDEVNWLAVAAVGAGILIFLIAMVDIVIKKNYPRIKEIYENQESNRKV